MGAAFRGVQKYKFVNLTLKACDATCFIWFNRNFNYKYCFSLFLLVEIICYFKIKYIFLCEIGAPLPPKNNKIWLLYHIFYSLSSVEF